MPTDEEMREEAIRAVKRKRGFKNHLAAYIIVNAFLWVLYVIAAVQEGEWWPWPLVVMAGWGIGLALNWRAAYGRATGPITEEEIQHEIDRQKGGGA